MFAAILRGLFHVSFSLLKIWAHGLPGDTMPAATPRLIGTCRLATFFFQLHIALNQVVEGLRTSGLSEPGGTQGKNRKLAPGVSLAAGDEFVARVIRDKGMMHPFYLKTARRVHAVMGVDQIEILRFHPGLIKTLFPAFFHGMGVADLSCRCSWKVSPVTVVKLFRVIGSLQLVGHTCNIDQLVRVLHGKILRRQNNYRGAVTSLGFVAASAVSHELLFGRHPLSIAQAN